MLAYSSQRMSDRPFQRKKIGSIRDNPKLFKIRQQFENASCESEKAKDKYKRSYGSAPSSISLSFSKFSDGAILTDLLKLNGNYSGKTKDFINGQSNSESSSRKNSLEKEEQKSVSRESIPQQVLEQIKASEKFWRVSTQKDTTSGNDFIKPIAPTKSRPSNDNLNTVSGNENERTELESCGDLSPESGVHTCSSTSEEDSFCFVSCELQKSEDHSGDAPDCDKCPPPIPRRGVSPAVQNSQVYARAVPSKQVPSPVKGSTSPQSVIKSNSVRHAIQMYEGMSSDSKKSKNGNYSKIVRRDSQRDHHGKRNGIYRRSSKRSSIRKRSSVNKDDVVKGLSASDTAFDAAAYKHSKEDSGVVFSDSEDNRCVYQTLAGASLTSPDDPYDRLNRIHDVMSSIHKGQSASCAACRAIPPGSLQLASDIHASSMLQVECKELSAHHHPPCICFACQHSVFSCSKNAESAEVEPQDSLYYNVCCLNPPHREGWRQSRRRPVCEQNGRLCVVNCEQESRRDFYENLTEWQSVPSDMVARARHPSKHGAGDSCDSDEGWVDVTDSEEEKNSPSINASMVACQHSNKSPTRKPAQKLIENSTYAKDLLSVQPEDSLLDISRSSSTEHLYESIADMDYGAEAAQHLDALALGGEPENELDSGEWSTESPSPTFGETPAAKASSSHSRFALGAECQDPAKKTFMKSVLGKKVSPKKRRMSNFFVPWLVSNQEYGPSSRGHKAGVKKQTSHPHRASEGSMKAREAAKSKRSQSVPSCALAMSCAKGLFSSAEGLHNADLDQSSNRNSDSSYYMSAEIEPSISPRGSVASSAYLRADQLQSVPSPRPRPSLSEESVTDVSVERVCRRPSSADSEHSYILFQPVKEEEVPLYQFYERRAQERSSFCRSPGSLSPVLWSSLPESTGDWSGRGAAPKPQLSVVEQLSPDAADLKMLWCELPEVRESGLLGRISAQELKLQEAAFEFIQSQASFVRSLKVLTAHFAGAPEFAGDVGSPLCVLSKHEHDVLFADGTRLKDVGEGLLGELASRWSDGVLIPDICDILLRHVTLPSFSVYVKYCSNRIYQERTLKELKESRPCFVEALRKLESHPTCQGLSLESFLLLPMQHVARLPLLVDGLFRWIALDHPSYHVCEQTLKAVHKVFVDCNEGARKMERLEEMFVLNKQLEFKDCKVLPLISASRWLLKRGELTKLEIDKKTFGRSSRCVRLPVYLFLFNDLLVITKRKSEESYAVWDYCPREKVQAMAVSAKDVRQPVEVPGACPNLLYLTLFSNHQGGAVDMILNCALLSERTRWIEAIHTVPKNKPCEIWEYDCPQVQCVRNYVAQQPDELSLQESDVVTIHRKMNDGWYEGRRLRDGLQGWFPASSTIDIPCSRARASNLRQCYRLLMLPRDH